MTLAPRAVVDLLSNGTPLERDPKGLMERSLRQRTVWDEALAPTNAAFDDTLVGAGERHCQKEPDTGLYEYSGFRFTDEARLIDALDGDPARCCQLLQDINHYFRLREFSMEEYERGWWQRLAHCYVSDDTHKLSSLDCPHPYCHLNITNQAHIELGMLKRLYTKRQPHVQINIVDQPPFYIEGNGGTRHSMVATNSVCLQLTLKRLPSGQAPHYALVDARCHSAELHTVAIAITFEGRPAGFYLLSTYDDDGDDVVLTPYPLLVHVRPPEQFFTPCIACDGRRVSCITRTADVGICLECYQNTI